MFHRHALCRIGGRGTDGVFDDPFFFARVSLYECEVGFPDVSAHELAFQELERGFRLCDDEEAGRSLVQAVDDAGRMGLSPTVASAG